MAINLLKGQRVSIGLQHLIVGLGWDPAESGQVAFDLDATACLLDEGQKTPNEKFFVFYNNQSSPDGACKSTGDDLTGGNSDGGDDEQIIVDLTKVDPRVKSIVFSASISEVTAVEFGRLYLQDGEWKFEALGNGRKDGLQGIVNKYVREE